METDDLFYGRELERHAARAVKLARELERMRSAALLVADSLELSAKAVELLDGSELHAHAATLRVIASGIPTGS